jgi:hypothetical protein
MKIEHLLARHLYNAKTLTLQGIGTFTLPSDFVIPSETDKTPSLQEGSITFTQNFKAAEDPALIDFIVQHSRKMKALASSDLESFLGLGTQFLNIGKPFKLEGIGMLEKNQNGHYDFTQYGQIVGAKAEEVPVPLREKRTEPVSYSTEEPKSNGNTKKILLGVLGVAALAVSGWAVWYFLANKSVEATESIPQAIVPTPITPAPSMDTATKKDTLLTSAKPDSINNLTPAVTTGGTTFKVVVKTYPTLAIAQKKVAYFATFGHNLVLYNSDTLSYKLAVPFTKPLSDTTWAKDSLYRIFSSKPKPYVVY